MTIPIALFFSTIPSFSSFSCFSSFPSLPQPSFPLLLDFGSLRGNLWSLHVPLVFCLCVSLVSNGFIVICPSFPLLHLAASHFLLERKRNALLHPWWSIQMNWEGRTHTCCLTYTCRSLCLSLSLWSTGFHYLMLLQNALLTGSSQ